MKHSLRSHEAKRTRSPPCAEGTLHRTSPGEALLHELRSNSLHAPQVRFIEKSTLSRAFFCDYATKSHKGYFEEKIEVCRDISAISVSHRLAQPNSTIRAFKPYEIAQSFLLD